MSWNQGSCRSLRAHASAQQIPASSLELASRAAPSSSCALWCGASKAAASVRAAVPAARRSGSAMWEFAPCTSFDMVFTSCSSLLAVAAGATLNHAASTAATGVNLFVTESAPAKLHARAVQAPPRVLAPPQIPRRKPSLLHLLQTMKRKPGLMMDRVNAVRVRMRSNKMRNAGGVRTATTIYALPATKSFL